jgi:hypothetical protein
MYVFIMHRILTATRDSFFSADVGAFQVHSPTKSEAFQSFDELSALFVYDL